MFRRKADVDKHVKDLLRKVKSEHERNLRCYHIASMYYKAQDFESAKKYVSMYLSVRDDSSLAHKLLGQCYEGLNLKDKALAAYRRSLELEANQAELILKICELLCDKDVTFDPIMARYWADRASSLFPHDASVFMLKEKLLTADDNIASDDLENLLHSELKARPTDVSVRIKLLNLYVDSGRTELALNHGFDVESRQAHSTNLCWYQCISHVCEVYHKEMPAKCDWEFYIQWMSALDRVCSLSLSEILQGSDLIESTETIYNLDQIIFQASTSILNPPEIYREFIKHIGAQLMFHLTVLLLKRAKKQGNGLWKETKRMIVPLLLMASFDSSDMTSLRNTSIKETHQKLLKNWTNHSRCRIVQAGQMLFSLVKEAQSEKLFLEKVFHFTVNNWKLQIFQKVFASLDELNHSTSYFLTSNSNIPQKIPSQNSFKPSTFVPNFEAVYVGSLHHLVWLGIQSLQNCSTVIKCKIAPTFHSTYFKNLQFTVSRLNNVGVETLNQLDIDSFLYATVFCTGITLEDQKVNGYFPPDRPPILPADISVPLCTVEQTKWWTGACSITKSGGDSLITQAKSSMSELRHLLQRGLEIVRGENIPLPLLINLARTFSLRASESEKIDEAEGCEARALYLWQLAIPQLERLATGQSLNKYQKTNSFFEYPTKDLELYEVNGLLEEARYFVGCHLMKTEKYEEAIENFKNLNTPQASFNQALIYQKLAEQQINGYRGEEVTSEMRCNQAVMASKARDSLFRARDMIKDSHSHPFYHKIKDKLLEVDELLSRIEPENTTSNLFSLGLGDKDICNTDGNLSCESGGSPGLIASNTRANHSSRFHPTSTPNRHYEPKHRNNSAEVVEILTMQQNTSQLKMQQVLEHLKLTLEKIESVIFEQRSQKNLLEDLTSKFNSLETETKNILSDIKKEVKRPDLYNMIEDEEYPDEMLQYQNYTSYYPPQRNVQGSSAVAYGAPAVPQYFSPRVDQMYQGNVGFYNQGALPFSDGQQLPDFLRTMQPKLPPSLTTPQGIASLQSSLGLSAPTAAGSAPPIGGLNTVNRLSASSFHVPFSLSSEANRIPTNVVITTSDTLPKGVPPVQPPLSVTIPPHHRLGDIGNASGVTNNTPGAPHQFQIQLPPQQSQQQQTQQQQRQQTLQQQPQQQTQLQQPHHSLLQQPHHTLLQQPHHTLLQQPHHTFLQQPQNAQKTTLILESEEEVTTNESLTQYDATSDFKPVTSFLKESAVVTGEEQEDVMFIGKARLLRYADNIWKERGTGDLKILKDKANNKARILMRREKVHKICANHFLTSDMELVSMQPKGVAWSWTANDFSEEEMHIERFCAKFKNVEDGQRFKDVFDKVKSGLAVSAGKDDSSTVSDISTGNLPSKSVSTTVSSTASTMFAPSSITPSQFSTWRGSTDTSTTSTTAANKINAGGFTFLSPPKLTLPEEMKVTKPAETKKTESPFANFSFTMTQQSNNKVPDMTVIGGQLKEPQSKIATNKNVLNTGSLFSSTDNAVGIGGGTTVSSFSSAQNSFFLSGSKPFSENQIFSFQTPKVFGDNSNTPNKQTEGSKQIQLSPFQGAGSKLFGSDNKVQTSALSKSPSTTETEAPLQNTEDEFVPTATFEPVVPLPELVQLVSGEEGETSLFEERAKLYRFCKETKQWKERGIGKMKLLKNEETGVVRLVMRREQVLKVCCNHRLTKDIVLSPSTTSDRSYSWAAKDFSDENSDGVNEIFTLKLKNVEQALAFKEAFEKAQANSVESSPAKFKEKFGNEPQPLKTNYMEGTWECPGCYLVNYPQTVKCLACCTSKPGVSPLANKDSTTTTSFAFTFGYPQTSATTSTTNTSQEKSSLSSLINRPADSWNCNECYVQNKSEDSSCLACKANKPDNKPTVPSVFSYSSPKFDNSGFFVSSAQSSLCLGESQTSLLGQKSVGFASTGFIFGTPNNNKESATEDTIKGPKSVFNFGVTSAQDGQGSKSTFTFSLNKASSAHSTGNSHKHDSGSEHGDSDNEGTANESDIYFQPVIPMPEKITIITGEEDETVLYSHRAKLYRYDIKSKEWKERGVGDIKILKHNTNGKIRLLLRREPVFKLSLNHFLTTDIEMKKKDDKSWIWCAKDFASGEVVQEQFAIRFKTPEIAEEFKKAVDDAKSIQKTTGSSPKVDKEVESSSPDSEGVEIVYEQKVSEHLRKKAESLMLPPNFYSYLNAKPCPGCPGCEPDEDDKQLETTNKDVPKCREFLNSKKETKNTSKVILRQPLLSGVQSSTSPQPTKNESSSANIKSDTFIGQTPSTGKENASNVGFFTQSSFFSSPTTNMFGGSTTESKTVSQTSIFGGSPVVTDSIKTPQTTIFGVLVSSAVVGDSTNTSDTTIFGGSADVGDFTKIPPTTIFGSADVGDFTKIPPTTVFGGSAVVGDSTKTPQTTIFGGISTGTKSNQKFFFGDSAQFEGKPSAQQSIFGGTPSGGHVSNPPQNLFFGAGAGDLPNLSQSVTAGGGQNKEIDDKVRSVTLKGDSGSGDQGKQTLLPTSGALSESENQVLQKPMFGNQQELPSFSSISSSLPSFSSISSNSSNTFGNSSVKWEGAGSTVFGNKLTNDSSKSTINISVGSDDAGNEDTEHDPHFEPVIAMPDLIDLKTGEEDEHLLFNERAKLYRFDSQAKEWKERGVGQMKILKHKESNVYRILMRREIVHKVVCNQRISEDLEMKPLAASPQAFCWVGMNMAQEYEKPIMENLSVKFRNEDLAMAFKKHIDEAIKEIKS